MTINGSWNSIPVRTDILIPNIIVFCNPQTTSIPAPSVYLMKKFTAFLNTTSYANRLPVTNKMYDIGREFLSILYSFCVSPGFANLIIEYSATGIVNMAPSIAAMPILTFRTSKGVRPCRLMARSCCMYSSIWSDIAKKKAVSRVSIITVCLIEALSSWKWPVKLFVSPYWSVIEEV